MNFKPYGATKLLGTIEVLLDRMLVNDVICWADGNRRPTRPRLHRKSFKILSKVGRRNVRILGFGTKKGRHVVAILDGQQMRIEARIRQTAVL